ncbi:hypothetical protein [Mediterranea massiliensis]|uniref:hypothetical protein n=1 Tax=Mediterranea massiliensis TaxID=1841865 RepID=UPI00266BA9D7|nr:hypothetical protein [Mediterranea massiliensis]
MNTIHPYFSRLRQAAAAILALAAVTACQDEEPFGSRYPQDPAGDVTELRFISDPMQKYNVTTRSSDPKEDEEKKIKYINVFFFQPDGEYMTGGYLTGYPNAPQEGGYYKTSEGVSLLKVAPENITAGQGEGVTVYAVANVDTLFQYLNSEKRPAIISQMIADGEASNPKEALEKIVYRPQWPNGKITVGLPATGMPMARSKVINFTGSNVTPAKERIIEMKALMARVDINLRIDSEHASADGRFPSFLLTEWCVKNVPMQGSITPTPDDKQTGEGWGDNWTADTPEQQTGTTTFTNGEAMRNVCTFYVFENMQDAEWVKDAGEEWYDENLEAGSTGTDVQLYPPQIEDTHKQRYKPYLANKHATSIELHGYYSTYNATGSGKDATYEVNYTLYLGGNHTDNFQLKRNHQYKNNITIKGLLSQDAQTGEYTFDARVNVEEQDNDYYISILREQDHDAHFCVTPMDVYMFKKDAGTDVQMEVILGEVPAGSETATESTVPSWIRMERISAEDMAAGTVDKSGFSKYGEGGDHLATGTAWTAGNGKRAFFTNDLFDVALKNNTHLTLKHSRDRVYFYIDENLEQSSPGIPAIQPREATVTLIYKENGTEVSRRTLTLAQLPFLRVQVYGRDGDKADYSKVYPDNQNGDGVIYMEQIEEYLNHYDPLDPYQTDQVYPGLKWAEQNGVNINNGVGTQWQYDFNLVNGGIIRSWENFVMGETYTKGIIEAYRHQVMTLNSQPRSAAEYCWNRNKRNGADGIVTNAKYFLPAIRQMEDALTTYYNKFPEFQGNYYWSSTPGEGRTGGLIPRETEATDRARATKVKPDGSYETSNRTGDYYENNQGGYALRSEVIRIRAFRKDLNK